MTIIFPVVRSESDIAGTRTGHLHRHDRRVRGPVISIDTTEEWDRRPRGETRLLRSARVCLLSGHRQLRERHPTRHEEGVRE